MRNAPGIHEEHSNHAAGRAAAGGDSRIAGLRAELHAAAGPVGIAANRTVTTLAELRERADWFRRAMEVYACQPLGYWYAELATRFDRMADEIEASADAYGIVGGAA